jgi:hypothetical protein
MPVVPLEGVLVNLGERIMATTIHIIKEKVAMLTKLCVISILISVLVLALTLTVSHNGKKTYDKHTCRKCPEVQPKTVECLSTVLFLMQYIQESVFLCVCHKGT